MQEHFMTGLSYVFPIACVLLIVLFFFGCPKLNTFELCDGNGRMTKRDILILCLITLIYAAVAFVGLGDRQAPESFKHFSAGESGEIYLGGEKTLGGVRAYHGLNTGKYTLEYSSDGESWAELCEMEQDYTSLFKWKDYEISETKASFVRITSDSDVYLGELVLYDSAAEPIEGIFHESEPQLLRLFDEQGKNPDVISYLSSTYFDEIYHARTAFEHLEGIYPYEVSHPPLGKLIIAIGISLFGMTPFGWRFSGTLFGVLMLPVLYYFLKRMFKKTEVAACGTLIFAFDFMHYTQTRIATIDTYAVFFILLMYLFMYLYVSEGEKKHLALSGLFFGLGAASKWTCLYAGAGLAVIWLISWIIRIENGEEKVGAKFIKNCLFCVVFFVIVPAAIYYVSYYPYGRAQGMGRLTMFFSRDYAQTVLDNQQFMFRYHSGVHSEHPYSSRWYQWIVNERPILYYLNYFDDGTRSSFGAFLNPVLCWAGLAAMGIMAYRAFACRDKKAGFIFAGYLAQLLPWVFITRTTFEYHYFPSAVFLTLAIAYIFALIRENNRSWRGYIYGLTGMSVLLFAVFYPALSGMRVNASLASGLLKWLPSWPF